MAGGNIVPKITQAEHIGPVDTGDNIEAKRVAAYVWNGSTWDRMTQPGGTTFTDDAAFTVGTTTVTPVAGTYRSVRDAVDDGDAGAFAMNAKRGMYVSLETPNSDSAMDDTLDTVKVSQATAANLNATVVGTGTFGTQATLQTQTDTVMVGGVNIKEINAVTPLMGNGVTGTGSQRVTVASDNTPFAVKTDQTTHGTTDLVAADVTKVAGTATAVNNGTASAGTQRVAIASDNTVLPGVGAGATGSAVPANAVYNGVSDGTNLRGVLQAANALNSTGTGLPTAQVIGQFDDVAPTSITENQFGNLRMSANRNLYGTVRDAAGNERGANVTAGNALQGDLTSIAGTAAAVNNGTASAGVQRVTLASDSTGVVGLNTGTNSIGKISDITTSIVPGTGATNLGKAEDAQHASGDTGVAMLAVRDDTLNATSGTENDYEMLHTTADGALWVTQAPSTTNGWSTFNATSGDGSTALTNTAQQVKATTGTIGGWYIYNPNATATYVNIYNATSASVTVGTTNQLMVLCIPATSAANIEFGNGINFSTACSISATTTGGGNSAPATALEANIYYK